MRQPQVGDGRPPRMSHSGWLLSMSARSVTWAGPMPTTKAARPWKKQSQTLRRLTSRTSPRRPADAGRVIRDFADQGYDVIVTTSFGYMQPTFDVAPDFPDTVFIHISGYKTAENMGTGLRQDRGAALCLRDRRRAR